MFGRREERDQIARMLADARAGRARRHVLLGEAGVGKTTLCGYGADLARAEGMRVLWAQGVEWESMLPYAGLSELLRPLRDLVRGLPHTQQAVLDGLLRGTANNEDIFALGAATLGLLAAVGEQQPTLVVLDDVHWVDEPSVRALAFAARRLLTDRVAVLAAGRSVPLLLADWPSGELDGLNGDDARYVALQVYEGLSEAVLGELVSQTRGNPLALTESVRELTAMQRDGREALPDPLPLGEQGRASFGGVLRGLPERTRLALSVLAAAGPRAGALLTRMLTAMSLGMEDVLPAEQAGVVVMSDRGPAFRHPLLRSAALAETPTDKLRAIDLVLADFYEVDDPERYAWHLGRAVRGASEPVALAWERAARAVTPHLGAPAAADALERAALVSPINDRRPERYLRAARACFEAGHPDRCSSLLDELGHQEDPDLHDQVLLVRGDASLWIGAGAVPLAELSAVANSNDPAKAERATTAAVQLMTIGENQGDLALVRRFSERTVRSAELAGGPLPAMVRPYVARAGILCGDRSSVDALLGDRYTVAVADEVTTADVGLATAVAQAMRWCERFSLARSQLDQLIIRTRERGAASMLPYPLGVAAEVYWWLGEWALALSLAEESTMLGALTGQRVLVAYTAAAHARVASGMGLESRTRQAAATAFALAATTGARPARLYAHHALGLLELSLGNPAGALDELETAHELRGEIGSHGETVVPYLADLAEARALTGRAEDARLLVDALAEAGEREDSRWAAGVALRVRGLADDDYEGVLADALEVLPDVPVSFDRARTYLVLGEGCAVTAGYEKHVNPLAEAAKLFVRLGATPWADRSRYLLRAVGGQTTATMADTVGLTGQELQVCQAVAVGASNREVAAALFLSPKTVEHYLTRAYAKLGIRSRSQLTRLAHEGRLGTAADLRDDATD